MILQVRPPTEIKASEVRLPPSKSFLNRYLSLRYLCGERDFQHEDNEPNDVSLMRDLLSSGHSDLYAGDAGTVMRFGLAVKAAFPGEFTIRGEGRMHRRPIGILVGALRKMGAEITYLQEEGYPPLKVSGGQLKGGLLEVDASVSSQFISALLLIAPLCTEGMDLQLLNGQVSSPYTDMTISLMREFGAEVERHDHRITVKPGNYRSKELSIPADWSAASFIYELLALSDRGRISLPALARNGYQGDEVLSILFSELGVETHEGEDGIEIERIPVTESNPIGIDFKDCPDLFQPLVCTCFGSGIDLNLRGLHNLHLKESDRLEAVRLNLSKLGAEIQYENGNGKVRGKLIPSTELIFDSMGDHRMAMSLAALSIKSGPMVIRGAECVSKSFPGFWKVLEDLGFTLNEIH